MSGQRRKYRAYLLRLWQARQDETLSWRASLERARTGERKGFANLEALFAYLRKQTDGPEGSSAALQRKEDDNGSD